MSTISDDGGPEDLLRYLQHSREGLVRAIEGLGEHDRRRPLTPTATNLLGLVKHLAGVEADYLGDCVGRPFEPRLPWTDDDIAESSGDMYATADESGDEIVTLYRRVWAHSDASVRELGRTAPAHVRWWPEDRRQTTLGSLLVRVVDETARHAGHADILRELLDGQAGRDQDSVGDRTWWQGHVARVKEAADAHRRG